MTSITESQAISTLRRARRRTNGIVGACGAGSRGAPLDVELVSNGQQFVALAEEWRELLANSTVDGIFLTWEWLYTWWDSLAVGRQLLLLAVRRGNKLVGLAPLCIASASPRRCIPFRTIELLGSGIVGSDYLDLIIRRDAEGEVAEALAGYLNSYRTVLMLSGVESGSKNMELLMSALVRSGWSVYRTPAEHCPYVDTAGLTWGEYYRSLGKMHREVSRRKHRRANERHVINYVNINCEEARRKGLSDWIDLHTKRWALAGGTQAVPDNGVRKFHDRLTAIALERGWLRLSVLEFDGVPAAAVYGFIYNRKYYFYQTGYDPAFGRFSPGTMCLEYSLKSALEEGACELDFLHGTESYKFIYARQMRHLVRYSCSPPSGAGALYRTVLWGRRMARRALGRADAAREEKLAVCSSRGGALR